MATVASSTAPPGELTRGHLRVIAASSMGTVFEWYDFYLYGSLAVIIGKQFFGGLNDTSQFIFALMAFAAGFAVRPFGALVFGRLMDHGQYTGVWIGLVAAQLLLITSAFNVRRARRTTLAPA